MAQQVFCICWTGKAIRQDLLCKRTSLSLLSPQLSPWLNAFTLSKQFRREIQCGVCMHIFAERKNYQGWDKSVRSKLCEWVLFSFSRTRPDLVLWWPPMDTDILPSLSCFLYTSCSSIALEVMIDAMSPPASSLRGILHSSSIGISSEPLHIPSTLSCLAQIKVCQPLGWCRAVPLPRSCSSGTLAFAGFMRERKKQATVWNIQVKNVLGFFVLAFELGGLYCPVREAWCGFTQTSFRQMSVKPWNDDVWERNNHIENTLHHEEMTLYAIFL